MATYYKTKVIRTPNLIQFYCYGEPITKDYESIRDDYNKSDDGLKQQKSLDRARNNLIMTIESNLTKYTKMLTLTFAENLHDRNQAFTNFKIFKQQFKKEFGYPLKYVAITEPQKRRQKKYKEKYPTIHFHIIVFNDKKLPFNRLKKLWGKYGSLYINVVDSIENVSIYLAKYLTKDNLDLNKKALTKSRNLKEPITDYYTEYIIPKNYSYSNYYSIPRYDKQGKIIDEVLVQMFEIRVNKILDI